MGAWIAACDGIQPLDLVIANAGISGGTGRRGAPHEDELDGLARSIFAINVDGLFNTLHPVIPLMTQRKQGQIAIMASLASFRGFAGSAAYCASKAMVRVYGEALRDELKVDGIAVNVVCPGFIKTPMTDANPFPMPFMMSAERAAHIIKSGLAHNRARIAFPWRLYAMIRLLNLLPQDWMARWTSRLPRKS